MILVVAAACSLIGLLLLEAGLARWRDEKLDERLRRLEDRP